VILRTYVGLVRPGVFRHRVEVFVVVATSRDSARRILKTVAQGREVVAMQEVNTRVRGCRHVWSFE